MLTCPMEFLVRTDNDNNILASLIGLGGMSHNDYGRKNKLEYVPQS